MQYRDWNPLAKYLFNIVYSIDQALNVLLGGNPDQTISGRVGYLALAGGSTAKKLETLINLLIFFHKDHCYQSIEWRSLGKNSFYFPNERELTNQIKAMVKSGHTPTWINWYETNLNLPE